MIEKIKSALRKLGLFIRPKEVSQKKHVSIDTTTVLVGGLKLRFDVGAEDRQYVQIGKCGMINAQFIFESRKGFIKIGNDVHIGGAALICRTGINIGNDVIMAWGVTIYDHNSHSIYWEYRKDDAKQYHRDHQLYSGNGLVNKNWDHVESQSITIEDKAWIGFDVTILKGVTIGEGAVIGAKSVVTKDVPAWTVVAGNPARVVKALK